MWLTRSFVFKYSFFFYGGSYRCVDKKEAKIVCAVLSFSPVILNRRLPVPLKQGCIPVELTIT